MSNLVPELRPNKNGFSAIKWVKPNDGGSAAAAVIPAPQAVAKPAVNEKERKFLVYALTTKIDKIENADAQFDGEEPRVSYDDLHEKLDSLDYTTLSVIEKHIPKNADEASYVADLILGTESSEQVIREAMMYRDCFEEYVEPERVISFTNGIRSYDAFGDDEDLSALTGDRLEAARSLCKVTDIIHTWLPDEKSPLSTFPATADYRHITDENLVKAIIEYPHRGDDIVELIQNRNEADGEVILRFVENGTALAVGEL